MIHPRVLFSGNPAAATPWVGIAKKLARECYDLKIVSKLYQLGSDVRIRVQNVFPIAGTLDGICKVWIEAGEKTANFLVYPRDENNVLGFYAVSPLAFRHPGSLFDLFEISLDPRYNNIAKLKVTPTSIKVDSDNLYKLCGNHFFFKRIYDEESEKFVTSDKTLYSWLGSPLGDCGFAGGSSGFYINSNSGIGIGYVDAGGTYRSTLRAIFKDGDIFKSFSTGEYPSLANSYISGFFIKDIEYQDAEDNTQTLTIYLVAFTFLAGTTKRYDTEIHIYDSEWIELKSITLFDFSTYTYKPLFHPVRFNHDATECVMINFYSSADFSEKVETDICSLLYEADEDGNLTITENITRETVSIRATPTSIPSPVVTTSTETFPGYSISTITTVSGGVSTTTTPKYPIAVNYNDKNERVFAYYSSIATETTASNDVEVRTSEIPSGWRISTAKTGTLSYDFTSVARFIFFDDDIVLNSNYQLTAEYESFDYKGTTTEIRPTLYGHQYANGTNSNTEQKAVIMYIDVALQFLILCETSSAKTSCSPNIRYNWEAPYEQPRTWDFNFSGVDYEIQSSGTYKIYQAGREPKIIANYSDAETHSASASGNGSGSFDSSESQETRNTTLSYTLNCGSTVANDSISYTRTADNPMDDGTRLTSFGALMGFIADNVYVSANYGLSTSSVDYGVISLFGAEIFSLRNENIHSYYSTTVETQGPFYGQTYADFSYCIDPRVKFGADYPWLMTFKLVHHFVSYVDYAPTNFPARFTALGAWTNGGYVQDISQPGRFNEFISESLVLGPIGLY